MMKCFATMLNLCIKIVNTFVKRQQLYVCTQRGQLYVCYLLYVV